ncbi:MAG: Sua5/YciO/YrdC/YwlC family protein [Candidatus Calescibacterium sp.]|nr:Sua5/YciO/YrdC/YwlC family protein [Candidatus Calescibacterium sp.]MDW8195828.1 Sua5/YciO/YrdC/YwlC family protein [Candidatus Calescibacterium sp.]
MAERRIFVDKPICKDCLNEMLTQTSRRYFYPFIGCNNCGSFFSSLYRGSDVYFNLCTECRSEYNDVSSPRKGYEFISCCICGPKVFLVDNQRNELVFSSYADLFRKVCDFILQGEVLILKTSNIFYLICDATNREALDNLRKIKKTFKPLPVMFKDKEMLSKYVRTREDFKESFDIRILEVDEVSLPSEIGFDRYLGVSIASDPFFVLLFEFLDRPIVYTSANISSESPYISNNEIFEKFSDKVKYFVLNNFDIKTIQDFSIVYNSLGVCIRRGIGRVGQIIETDYNFRDCICLGPELESSVTVCSKNRIFISSRLGHLINEHVFKNYEKLIDDMLYLFSLEPEVVVSDLHPYYLSTELGRNLSNSKRIEFVQVQHHKAHVYSLILDRQIQGKIIGFSFDGTGYGEDGKIWGGEVFVGDFYNLDRVAHFKYIPIVAGDSAIENPILIALSFVCKFLPDRIDLFRQMNKLQLDIVTRQIQTDTNVYYTSSVGRLFDIAAVLLKVRGDQKIAFSGQAAIELEKLATRSNVSGYLPFEIFLENSTLNIDLLNAFRYILDRRDFENYTDIARKFHNTIVQAMYKVAILVRDKYGINKVGFSGGVFQNKILCHEILKVFHDFEVYFHRDIPPNDSGISLGQLQGALIGGR